MFDYDYLIEWYIFNPHRNNEESIIVNRVSMEYKWHLSHSQRLHLIIIIWETLWLIAFEGLGRQIIKVSSHPCYLCISVLLGRPRGPPHVYILNGWPLWCNNITCQSLCCIWGHPFMASTKKIRFLTPLSTWAGPPSPLVDVHMRSTWNTHRSLEMASTMTYRT